LHYVEPAYAAEVDWLLCDALDSLGQPNGESCYLRLSTRPIDQAPFGEALERYGEEVLHRHVLDGGYRLVDAPPTDRPGVTLVTTGVMAPEALAAARELDDEGVQATVIHLTSPDRAYRSWQHTYANAAASAHTIRRPSQLHRLIPPQERRRPVVSVHDGASHSLAWIGSALGTRQYCLGVDRFGESGTIGDLHEVTGISAGNIINAALIAISETDDLPAL
ncbi:MAG: transketolase C-terminal domain-containing protein, partial [Acidimicrobiales bacterium]